MFASSIEVFKAMGSKPRQLILEVIERGVKNPGHICRELGLPRSTVEKHIRILLDADLVRKVPILNDQDRISVSYEINSLAFKLREAVNL